MCGTAHVATGRAAAVAWLFLAAWAVPCAGAQGRASWTLEVDLSIDVEGIVGFLAVGADGSMYVTDPVTPSVSVYRVNGSRRRVVALDARAGPAFESVDRLGWRGDTLYVTDSRTGQVAFLRADGALIAIRVPAVPATAAALRSTVSALLAYGTAAVHSVPAGDADHAPVWRVDAAGEILDTIARRPYRINQMIIGIGGGRLHRNQPFPDASVLIGFARDGSSYAVVEAPEPGASDAASFRVTHVTAGGDTLFSRPLDYEPLAVENDVIERAIRATVTELSSRHPAEPRDSIDRAVRAALRRPRHHPPVGSVLVARDGTVWLQRWTAPDAVPT